MVHRYDPSGLIRQSSFYPERGTERDGMDGRQQQQDSRVVLIACQLAAAWRKKREENFRFRRRRDVRLSPMRCGMVRWGAVCGGRELLWFFSNKEITVGDKINNSGQSDMVGRLGDLRYCRWVLRRRRDDDGELYRRKIQLRYKTFKSLSEPRAFRGVCGPRVETYWQGNSVMVVCFLRSGRFGWQKSG